MSVSARFQQFVNNIRPTKDQVSAGNSRRESVVACLNRSYYSSGSSTNNSFFVGSWAKYTRVRPPRDVDVLYELPYQVYERFNQRTGNIQSQILQEVRSVLLNTFPSTAIRGDGPVVVVPFTSYNVELIPTFKLKSGEYWICMTNSGGHYKTADYLAEAAAMKASQDRTGMTRDLVRMMKRWQAYCSVPIKSFHIELVAIDFLENWDNRGKGYLYYDFMVRDFLHYLYNRANGYVSAPGTGEVMALGSAWQSKTSTAYYRAEKACSLENEDSAAAGDEWQKVFGTDIPKYV